VTKIIKKPDYSKLLKRISVIIEEVKRKTFRQINIIITGTYCEIGKAIIEVEQKGKKRAKYGTELLLRLSNDLTQKFGKGYSVDNLEAMRKFYLVYPYLLNS